jgi:metalloendopeptidase OMA1, mitochondrial
MMRLCNTDRNINFTFVQLVLLVPLALVWALLPNDGIALVANWFIDKVVAIMVELPFSRDMETEADEVGMLMAAKVRMNSNSSVVDPKRFVMDPYPTF